MKRNASTNENLRWVFTEGFAARDVAEPLASFDASTSVAEGLSLMKSEDFDVMDDISLRGAIAEGHNPTGGAAPQEPEPEAHRLRT
jgi:hypothetical protein